MCFRLRMMKTHFSLKSSESEESLKMSDSNDWTGGLGTGVTTNEHTPQKHCIRRRPESSIMPHSTALPYWKNTMVLPWYTTVYHGSTMVCAYFTMVPRHVPWYTMVGSMVYHGKIQCTVVIPWYRLFYTMVLLWFTIAPQYTMVQHKLTMVESVVYHGKTQALVALPWYTYAVCTDFTIVLQHTSWNTMVRNSYTMIKYPGTNCLPGLHHMAINVVN